MVMDVADRLADLIWREYAGEPDLGFQAAAIDLAAFLVDHGVWLPPDGAEMTEGRMVQTLPGPFASAEVGVGPDGEMTVTDGGLDITEQYRQWLDSLPGIIVRTYEWPEQADGQ